MPVREWSAPRAAATIMSPDLMMGGLWMGALKRPVRAIALRH